MTTDFLQTASLFDDVLLHAPATQGIKYAGSKLKLLPYILQMTKSVSPQSVFDGFSGTTRVSQALAQVGYRVIANDVAVWSNTFAKCYLRNPHSCQHYKELIQHLNHLPGKEGWFTEHYGGEVNRNSEECMKRPWQKHNTQKLDAIRDEIERLSLDQYEKAVLLTSLMLALDEVDSTLGHYASYLREWSPRSYKILHLEVPQLLFTRNDHEVYQKDIFDCVQDIQADIAYLDPPYGSNNEKMPPSRVRYGAYYHLWTTVCLFDKPVLFGKANRRADTSDNISSSVFEDFRRDSDGKFVAVKAIERLLATINVPFILLSYSSGGRATAEELQQTIETVGRLREVITIDYKRNVMGGMRWTNEWIRDADEPNREFLFLIEKC